MRGRRQAVLAIDEGSDQTRAALVTAGGSVAHSSARPIDTSRPTPLVVEQDAAQIWDRTRGVIVDLREYAEQSGYQISAVAIVAQRGTALMWRSDDGRPLTPAVTGEDRRYAADLAAVAPYWDAELMAATGRPVGSQAPLLWAARVLADDPDVAAAYDAGVLRFGTIDSWLLWNLSGGDVHAVSASHAAALGSYDLGSGDWYRPWVDNQRFPADLLPRLADDVTEIGLTDRAILGFEAPILTVIAEQQAALVGLQAGPGDLTCTHGTGCHVHLLGSEAVAGAHPRTPRLVGRRADGSAVPITEAHAPTTGAAIRWVCEEAGWFTGLAELTSLATERGHAGETPMFVPTLAGGVTSYDAPGLLSGLTLATTRGDIARSVLDGVAHTVADLIDALVPADAARVLCAGSLSASDALLQAQADLTGLPMHRPVNGESAALRGAAYLAGVHAGLWSSTVDLDGPPSTSVFEPALPSRTRRRRRQQWSALRDRVTGA